MLINLLEYNRNSFSKVNIRVYVKQALKIDEKLCFYVDVISYENDVIDYHLLNFNL